MHPLSQVAPCFSADTPKQTGPRSAGMPKRPRKLRTAGPRHLQCAMVKFYDMNGLWSLGGSSHES